MAMLLRLLPAILCLVLLCAHLVRAGMLVLVPLCLLMLPLLLVPRGWVARLWQVFLMAAALEWVRMAVFEAVERAEHGQPWLRMVGILGFVAVFNVVAALLFETEALSRFYPRRSLH